MGDTEPGVGLGGIALSLFGATMVLQGNLIAAGVDFLLAAFAVLRMAVEPIDDWTRENLPILVTAFVFFGFVAFADMIN